MAQNEVYLTSDEAVSFHQLILDNLRNVSYCHKNATACFKRQSRHRAAVSIEGTTDTDRHAGKLLLT